MTSPSGVFTMDLLHRDFPGSNIFKRAAFSTREPPAEPAAALALATCAAAGLEGAASADGNEGEGAGAAGAVAKRGAAFRPRSRVQTDSAGRLGRSAKSGSEDNGGEGFRNRP